MPPRRRRTSPRLDPAEVEENLVNEAAANATPIPAAEVERPAKPKPKPKPKRKAAALKVPAGFVLCDAGKRTSLVIDGREGRQRFVAENGQMTLPEWALPIASKLGINKI